MLMMKLNIVQILMLIILAIQIISAITVAILNPVLKKMRKRLNTTVYYDDPTLHRVIYTRYKKKCNIIEKARNIIRDKLITINHYIILILAIIQLIITLA